MVDKQKKIVDECSTIQKNIQEGESCFSKEALNIIESPVKNIISKSVISDVVQVIEAIFLGVIGLLIYLFYINDDLSQFYILTTILSVVLVNTLSIFLQNQKVKVFCPIRPQVIRILTIWSIVCLVTLILAFLLKESNNSILVFWIVSWYIVGVFFLVFFRVIVNYFITKWTKSGKFRKRIVIIGGGDSAGLLIDKVNNDSNIEILGIFDDRSDSRSLKQVSGVLKLGNVDQLVSFCRETRVDLIIISIPLSAESRIFQMLEKIWILPVDIRVSVHMSSLRFNRDSCSYIGDIPVFHMENCPISDWNLIFKWLFDKVVALILLILFLPIMIITAIAIKMDSKGSILFKQQRYGFNNNLIDVYKFRSMYSDMSDAKALKLTTRDDPRITRVGKFIRRTSIDELPQLFNVLKGELSIVGPRPHALQAKAADTLYNDAVDNYFARHKVKPGITGWAQIQGWRGETDTLDKLVNRVEHDLYYIENWSLWFDLYILIMTPVSLITKNENAF